MKRRVWPAMIFVLLAVNMTIVGVTVYAAKSDPSFAVVPSYDRQALAWNQTAQQRARSASLGWIARVDGAAANGAAKGWVRVRLQDRSGNAVTGARVSVTAFASVRAGTRYEVALSEREPGEYTAPFEPTTVGEWEFGITALRADDVFTADVSAEIGDAEPNQSPAVMSGGGS